MLPINTDSSVTSLRLHALRVRITINYNNCHSEGSPDSGFAGKPSFAVLRTLGAAIPKGGGVGTTEESVPLFSRQRVTESSSFPEVKERKGLRMTISRICFGFRSSSFGFLIYPFQNRINYLHIGLIKGRVIQNSKVITYFIEKRQLYTYALKMSLHIELILVYH